MVFFTELDQVGFEEFKIFLYLRSFCGSVWGGGAGLIIAQRIINYHIMTKLPYFIISPEKLVFVHFFRNIEWMNGNLFFFRVAFFYRPKKSNGWMTRGFSEKKTHKNTVKKQNQILLKEKNFIKIRMNDRWTFSGKKKVCWDLNEWMTDELFRGKQKKSCCVFFSLRGNKKKQDFWIWMNEWPTSMSA